MAEFLFSGFWSPSEGDQKSEGLCAKILFLGNSQSLPDITPEQLSILALKMLHKLFCLYFFELNLAFNLSHSRRFAKIVDSLDIMLKNVF